MVVMKLSLDNWKHNRTETHACYNCYAREVVLKFYIRRASHAMAEDEFFKDVRNLHWRNLHATQCRTPATQPRRRSCKCLRPQLSPIWPPVIRLSAYSPPAAATSARVGCSAFMVCEMSTVYAKNWSWVARPDDPARKTQAGPGRACFSGSGFVL